MLAAKLMLYLLLLYCYHLDNDMQPFSLCSEKDGIPPTFSKKPTIRQEDEGRRLLFECRIIADPKPTVTWYHDVSAVKESARCKVSVCKISIYY